MRATPSPQDTDKRYKQLAILLVIAGMAIRLIIYLQNRNFIIDEANVARNIYERGFTALARPLSYEQYAPPVFLWFVKLSSLLFGFSELSLKLFPFLCGVGSMYAFYLLLKEYVSVRSLWLPLALLGSSYIFIRYGTELKQYGCDILVMCVLILMALKQDILQKRPLPFLLIWIVAGTIAIWTSMPSVFTLAGVGLYYIWVVWRNKVYSKLYLLGPLFVVWLLQFLIYYIMILRPQANSAYLQNFHTPYFLYATPKDLNELIFNITRITGLIGQISGHTVLAILILLIWMVTGSINMVRKDAARSVLLLLPLVCLFVASALKQFSLIPRVSLFGIALFIVLVGYGHDVLRKHKWTKLPALFLSVFLIGSAIRNTYNEPFKFEQLTEGMGFVKKHNINASSLLLYHSSEAAYIYYTQIHPNKKEWGSLKGADLLKWDTDYDSLGNSMVHLWGATGPIGIIFTNATEAEYKVRTEALDKYYRKEQILDQPSVKAVIYKR